MSITVTLSPARLSWSDFAPVAALSDGSGDQAATATSMTPLDNIRPIQIQGRFALPDLTLTVGLDRTNTQVVSSAPQTDYLLKHEQGHFDITVLTVRAMARELELLRTASVAALGQQLGIVRDRHQQRADALELRYDADTRNAGDTAAQQTWNDAIDAAMRGLGVMVLQGMPL